MANGIFPDYVGPDEATVLASLYPDWVGDIQITVVSPVERGDGGNYEHKIYLPEKMPDYDIDDDIVIMAVIKKFLEIMND